MRKTREERRRAREDRKNNVVEKFEAERKPKPIVPKTQKQAEYLDALRTSDQVVAIGPEGVGKTWVAATYAADLFRQKKISKIVLTKPVAPAGRSIGFLPGDQNEKLAPWVAAMTEAIKERIGNGAFEVALKNGDIEVVSFETMRGRTFRDAFVILSEAQNATPEEMRMFLTRVGEDCQVVVDGSLQQKDIKDQSGLATIIHMIKKDLLPVPVIEFTIDDIVRSGVCAMWAKSFYRNGY